MGWGAALGERILDRASDPRPSGMADLQHLSLESTVCTGFCLNTLLQRFVGCALASFSHALGSGSCVSLQAVFPNCLRCPGAAG